MSFWVYAAIGVVAIAMTLAWTADLADTMRQRRYNCSSCHSSTPPTVFFNESGLSFCSEDCRADFAMNVVRHLDRVTGTVE